VKAIAIKELLERDGNFVRCAVQFFVHAALEAEMTEAIFELRARQKRPLLSGRLL
jgi:hypothetical protein